MKIIGKTNDGFILESSAKELANLIGFYSEYTNELPKVGSEIEIDHMYNQLYQLSYAIWKKKFKRSLIN